MWPGTARPRSRALGHPIGATGAILVAKALYELRRTGGRYGLVTMCIGGRPGQKPRPQDIGRRGGAPARPRTPAALDNPRPQIYHTLSFARLTPVPRVS